jgi:hypothetical protein
MPRTTKKPASPQQPAANGTVAGDVLTLAEAAAYLRLAEKDVIAAASAQGLPGRMVAGEWRFFKGAIQQWLSVSQPTAEMRKAAQLALIERYKDDAGWEELREEIARQRQQLASEVEG